MSVEAPDRSLILPPLDDGSAAHLSGRAMPSLALPATDGTTVDLSRLTGTTVVYGFPRTSRPGVAVPDHWDLIPGARGCTPQSCAFRDHHADLRALGVTHLFGLSTQDTEYQREAVERLHLPFPLLSDAAGALATALDLPVFAVESVMLLRRITLVIEDGRISRVFYPVFPPDRSAQDVMRWLGEARRPEPQ